MDNMLETSWAATQETLRKMLKPDIYDLWFAAITPRSLENDVLTLEVDNEFCELWITENYSGLLRDILAHVTSKVVQIRFEVRATPLSKPAEEKPKSEKPAKVVVPPEEKAALERELGFNPKNTFDSFVVGNNNSFSHAAAVAVAQNPGKAYNPLFVYGGVGLGKTHLLHAIGQYVASHRKGAKVAYLSSEKFTNEFIDALQTNQLVRFRKKYRQTDVLLIDDIQFLAHKERIQEEFFHTFNALHEQHRQIVMTCDRPAGEIQNLEQRLVSRFEWGLVTDLQPPDIETRLAILRKKAISLNLTLPEDIFEFLANRIRSNIRRLEGAMIRVASFASLTGKSLSVEVVEGLLREMLHEEGRQAISIDLIQKKVAEHYDIRLADMTSKRRPENIAFPRQVAMYLSRTLTGSSLNTIGEAFGGRDHGTVLHACRLVKDRMEVDPNIRQVVQYLEKHLQR